MGLALPPLHAAVKPIAYLTLGQAVVTLNRLVLQRHVAVTFVAAEAFMAVVDLGEEEVVADFKPRI